jgi:predicted regulator of Ras-like GTPase activity (Roadblock/LC7/MglB family)
MSTVRFSDVDTASALADLSEISSQIEAAVIFDAEGTVLGSTEADETRAQRLARTALDLVAAAGQVATGATRRLTQIEGSLREGSIFVVTGDERSIAATTTPEPTSGLVFYDLKTCLRSLATEPERNEQSEQPKRTATPRRKTKNAKAGETKADA